MNRGTIEAAAPRQRRRRAADRRPRSGACGPRHRGSSRTAASCSAPSSSRALGNRCQCNFGAPGKTRQSRGERTSRQRWNARDPGAFAAVEEEEPQGIGQQAGRITTEQFGDLLRGGDLNCVNAVGADANETRCPGAQLLRSEPAPKEPCRRRRQAPGTRARECSLEQDSGTPAPAVRPIVAPRYEVRSASIERTLRHAHCGKFDRQRRATVHAGGHAGVATLAAVPMRSGGCRGHGAHGEDWSSRWR